MRQLIRRRPASLRRPGAPAPAAAAVSQKRVGKSFMGGDFARVSKALLPTVGDEAVTPPRREQFTLPRRALH